MKDLVSVQQLLQDNNQFDFDAHVQSRIDSYLDFVTKKNPKPCKSILEDREKTIANLKDLYKYLQEYIVIALDVNPHIANYNKAIQENNLEEAKLHSILILDTYKKHNWREFRRLTGILRTKRSWLKGESAIKKDFFNKLTHASSTADQAAKIIKRKKALTVKSVYPYWLW